MPKISYDFFGNLFCQFKIGADIIN